MILLGDSLFEYGTFNEVDFALVPALQQREHTIWNMHVEPLLSIYLLRLSQNMFDV